MNLLLQDIQVVMARYNWIQQFLWLVVMSLCLIPSARRSGNDGVVMLSRLQRACVVRSVYQIVMDIRGGYEGGVL